MANEERNINRKKHKGLDSSNEAVAARHAVPVKQHDRLSWCRRTQKDFNSEYLQQ